MLKGGTSDFQSGGVPVPTLCQASKGFGRLCACASEARTDLGVTGLVSAVARASYAAVVHEGDEVVEGPRLQRVAISAILPPPPTFMRM